MSNPTIMMTQNRMLSCGTFMFMWSLDADYDRPSQDLLNAMYRATVKGPRRR